MSPTSEAILTSWSLDSKIALAVAACLLLYLRGWWVLHRTSPERFPTWRLWAFIGGLAASWLAIASPLDAFSGLLLSAHMVQHLLLMSVAPPLLLLGAPFLPLLRGLPRKFARDGVGPFLVWPALRRAAQRLTHPVSCWIMHGNNPLRLARAGTVRAGASLACLAQGRARLFPGGVAPLLVARGSPLPQPAAVAGMVGAPLPARSRFVEYDALGDTHVLGPCALPAVPSGTTPVRDNRAERPELRRCAHVGARLAGVPDPSRVDCNAIPLGKSSARASTKLSCEFNSALGSLASPTAKRSQHLPLVRDGSISCPCPWSDHSSGHNRADGSCRRRCSLLPSL